jgi:hypothetical protein
MKILDFIFSEQPLPSDFKDKIKTMKWFINNESDYIDLETDITYKTFEDGNVPHLSFNLFATLDLQNKHLYFLFGNNKGEGFNEMLEFRYAQGTDMNTAFDKALKESDDKSLKSLAIENSSDILEIKSRMNELVKYLESSYA